MPRHVEIGVTTKAVAFYANELLRASCNITAFFPPAKWQSSEVRKAEAEPWICEGYCAPELQRPRITDPEATSFTQEHVAIAT